MAEVFAFLMTLVVIIATVYAVYLLVLCSKRKFAIVKIEDGALAPSSVQMLVLFFATVIGGLWAAFTVAVSGSLDLQRLQLEEQKNKAIPELIIDMQTETFAPVGTGPKTRIPLSIVVTIENASSRVINNLQLKSIPLLSYMRVDNSAVESESPIGRLPFVKLECLPGKDTCTETQWIGGYMAPGSKQRWSFFHRGLEPGIYYVQFQLLIPRNLLPKDYIDLDPTKPEVWERGKYIQVKIESPNRAGKPI